MSDKDLKVTLKAGTGYDAPWVSVDAENPDELDMKLRAITEGQTLSLVVDAASALKAVYNATPLTQPAQQQAPQQQPKSNGWGNSAPAAQSAPANNGGGVRYHPEGLQCNQCGSAVQYKTINAKSGKTFNLWTCPNQRSKDDGHYSTFAD